MAPTPRKNLSSPSTSPVYTLGAVQSVRPQSTIADYKRRLDKTYQTPIKKKVPKITVKPKTAVDNSADTEYQALMQKYKGNLEQQRSAAANLFKRNKGALETDLTTTKSALAKQRGADLNDIADQAAARGIGRSSGIYKQAGTDYEMSYAERLKNADSQYNQQLKQEDETQKETMSAADREYADEAAVAAATRKAAALEAAKEKETATPSPLVKPKPKILPRAAPKPTPPKGKAKAKSTKYLYPAN